MATGYVLKVGDAAVKQWVSFYYEFTLNGLSNCQIAIDGASTVYFAEFDVDKEVSIYKGGTLKFRGNVETQKSLTGGGIVLTCIGREIDIVETKCPMIGTAIIRAFTSTDDDTIITTLIGAVTGWSINVTNSTASSIDSFRVSASESVWNAIIRLIDLTGKDIYVDQENKTLYLYDEYTRDDQFSYIEGKNATGITKEKSKSRASTVKVYGKGDGENQIIGSHGTGNPVEVVIDRNIISTTEADARAEVEYNRLNPNSISYSFTPLGNVDSLKIGDSGKIANNSARISETVDIVRIKISVSGNGTESILMQVTNSALRIADKSTVEEILKQRANYNQSQTSMQGSGNLSQWKGIINGNNGAGLKITFNIGDDFEDDAGNLRVGAMTLDYDIDPFRDTIGTAVTDSHLHDVSPAATVTHKHDPSDTGHPHANATQTSTSSNLMTIKGSISDTEPVAATWDAIDSTVSFSGSFDFILVALSIEAYGWSGTDTIGIRVDVFGITRIQEIELPFNTTLDPIKKTYVIPMLVSDSGVVTVYMYSLNTQEYTVLGTVYSALQSHSHSVNSWNTTNANAAVDDNNRNPSLTGNSDNTAANVNIGDDSSDAGSINATSAYIYLDYWNGSTWVAKHSILDTGVTIDTDVDVTNAGTYPDAKGYWRVRVNTNNASPDLIQGVVNVKHALDN